MWYKVINIPHSGLFYVAFLLYNNSKTTESFLSILIFYVELMDNIHVLTNLRIDVGCYNLK